MVLGVIARYATVAGDETAFDSSRVPVPRAIMCEHVWYRIARQEPGVPGSSDGCEFPEDA